MKPPCVVLAGGRSSRMGGGDKGLMPLGDVPMLAHVLRAVVPQAASILINSNSAPSRFASFGLPVRVDALPGFLGPLAGILTGMIWAREHGATHVLSVACDTPFLPHNLVQSLTAGLHDAEIAIACDDDRSHPVVGLWPVSLSERLAADLASGTRALHRWLQNFPVAEVRFDARHFKNINTHGELEEAGNNAVSLSFEGQNALDFHAQHPGGRGHDGAGLHGGPG